MSSYELATGSSTGKGLLNVVTRYLNFCEVPQHSKVSKEVLIFNAWALTGSHLKKALKEYGKEIERQSAERRDSTERRS